MSLASKWDLFAAVVLPTDVGPAQRREMRRAFYAGAEAFRQILLDVPDAPGDEMEALDALQAEFEGFAADVAEGRA